MSRRDFKACYAALELHPGATDQEITRAKRAYNELYHSDRLAHMSEQARAIAADKVRAANEAAQTLLDPANRAARDRWVDDAQRPDAPPRPRNTEHRDTEAGPSWDAEWEEPPAGPATASPRPGSPTGRLVVIGLVAGGLLGTMGVVVRAGLARREAPATGAEVQVVPDTMASAAAPAPPAPRRPAPARAMTVMDSVLVLPGDGRWTPPVSTGGPSFRISFLPESEQAFYRVRTDGQREYVLLDEPGFLKLGEPAGSYQFSSMTGHPVRLRFSRWRVGAAPGTAVHQLAVRVPPDGSWSRRVYLSDMSVRWEADRMVGYEARDDRWRIMHIPPSVNSVFFTPYPRWIQFRSTDSLPLTLTVRYTAR